MALRPGPRLVEGLSEGSGALVEYSPQAIPWALLAHPLAQGWWPAGPPEKLPDLPLTSTST